MIFSPGVEVRVSKGQTGPNNPNWKGGRTVTQHGYVLIRLPGHHLADVRGYVYEHRLVAEEDGRRLKKGEEVHHENRVRHDNRPDNLEPLMRPEHMLRHRDPESKLRLPGEPNIRVPCACGCGKLFKRYDAQGRPRVYVTGHNEHASPTKDSLLALLERGPCSRKSIVSATGLSVRAVAVALSRLKREGVAVQVGHGIWALNGG